MPNLIIQVLCLLSIVTSLSVRAGDPIRGAPTAPPLERARAAYEQRTNAAQAKLAVDLYRAAGHADSQSCEVAWEEARACYYLGQYALAGGSDADLLALYQEGIDRAKAAVSLNPKGAEGHFWLAVLDGVYGETKGIFKSLAMVPDIKREAHAALDADRSVEGFGPDRLLGRLYFKLPGFKGGDNKKSIEYLERSVKGAPTNALTRLYLAETCKSEGSKEKAFEQLRFIVAMTPDPRWAPEHAAIKVKAEKLLDKWQ